MKTIEDKLQKYSEVYRHSCAVRDLATNFALYIGYSYQEAMKIRLGAYIHDVGKSFIDANVLFKEGPLTKEEFEIVKEHSLIGYEYLKEFDMSSDEDIMAIVVQHHERVDGKGYPFAMKGEEIHPYAKIVSLCDVYDALVSKRCYKDALSSIFALEIIKEGLGTQFDKELGEQFIAFIENGNSYQIYKEESLSS